MTHEKIVEVCDRYRIRLRELDLENARLRHVQNRMLELTMQFARDGRIEKAFRWLGFIQGVLWCEGVYTIDEMKRHNMPTEGQCQESGA